MEQSNGLTRDRDWEWEWELIIPWERESPDLGAANHRIALTALAEGDFSAYRNRFEQAHDLQDDPSGGWRTSQHQLDWSRVLINLQNDISALATADMHQAEAVKETLGMDYFVPLDRLRVGLAGLGRSALGLAGEGLDREVLASRINADIIVPLRKALDDNPSLEDVAPDLRALVDDAMQAHHDLVGYWPDGYCEPAAPEVKEHWGLEKVPLTIALPLLKAALGGAELYVGPDGRLIMTAGDPQAAIVALTALTGSSDARAPLGYEHWLGRAQDVSPVVAMDAPKTVNVVAFTEAAAGHKGRACAVEVSRPGPLLGPVELNPRHSTTNGPGPRAPAG